MKDTAQHTVHIGFIGQGFIGKAYADDFEERGYDVTRYALEEPYVANKEKIAACDIVFIAVPTPTTPEGFDDSIVRSVIKLVGNGNTAVIKSTMLPGSTQSIQEENPDISVMHSPEFLRAVTAGEDAKKPDRNIIGIARDTDAYHKRAQQVLAVLPEAPYVKICSAQEAELIKYVGNCFLYTKVIFSNMVYDLTQALDLSYDSIQEAVAADPRIGPSHMAIAHDGGRGAGGYCFIKDYAAFRELYEEVVADPEGRALLQATEQKNKALLHASKKDLDLLAGVYGSDKS